jgi:hypothetical protein
MSKPQWRAAIATMALYRYANITHTAFAGLKNAGDHQGE